MLKCLKSYIDDDNDFVEYDIDYIEPSVGMRVSYGDCQNIWTITGIDDKRNAMNLERPLDEGGMKRLNNAYIQYEWRIRVN